MSEKCSELARKRWSQVYSELDNKEKKWDQLDDDSIHITNKDSELPQTESTDNDSEYESDEAIESNDFEPASKKFCMLQGKKMFGIVP